ncbi:MAG: lytic murein transglycosylase [Candidatus Paceibacterota bacterium]
MSSRKKTRVFLDIRWRISPYGEIPERVYIKKEKEINIPLFKFLRKLLPVFLILVFMFSSVYAPTSQTIFAAENEEERAKLEAELQELEKQIAEYEATVEGYRRQGTTLKDEIKRIEANIAKLNLQVKQTTLSLDRLNSDIKKTANKITETESSIDLNKKNLAEILQNIHEAEGTGLVEILLRNQDMSNFFDDVNSVMLVQEGLKNSLQKIVGLRNDLIDQKETLALEKNDVEALRKYQDSQRQAVVATKAEKNELLTVTKGKESEYQELLKKTKQTAAEIRSRIFHLLGGGELTFEEAYKLAKFAEDATGIKAAFILSVLDQESALGKNVGNCTYQTAMHPTRDLPAFLEITKELGIDPNSVKVSCPIVSDGAYGGAMGPAQFIPSTWNLYKEGIAKITGNNPPSPWRNEDAFLATALYLKEAYYSSSCKNYATQIPSQADTLLTRCAAAKYYAGARWYTYRWVYGEPVVQRAIRFQADIDVLNS